MKIERKKFNLIFYFHHVPQLYCFIYLSVENVRRPTKVQLFEVF